MSVNGNGRRSVRQTESVSGVVTETVRSVRIRSGGAVRRSGSVTGHGSAGNVNVTVRQNGTMFGAGTVPTAMGTAAAAPAAGVTSCSAGWATRAIAAGGKVVWEKGRDRFADANGHSGWGVKSGKSFHVFGSKHPCVMSTWAGQHRESGNLFCTLQERKTVSLCDRCFTAHVPCLF